MLGKEVGATLRLQQGARQGEAVGRGTVLVKSVTHRGEDHVRLVVDPEAVHVALVVHLSRGGSLNFV